MMKRQTWINSTFIYFSLVMCIGCGRVATLGTRDHVFSEVPRDIVWIFAPGFHHSQVGLLKFRENSTPTISEFDESGCLGLAWSYNLFQLRPGVENSFRSQFYGTGNVTGSCEDLEKENVFKSYQKLGFKSFIYDHRPRTSYYQQLTSCSSEAPENEFGYWLSSTKEEHSEFEKFHYLNSQTVTSYGLSQDRACHSKSCDSRFVDNVKMIWEGVKSKNQNVFLLVRNFEIQDAIEQNNLIKLRESIDSLNKSIQYLRSDSRLSKNALIIVSSARARDLIYPPEGKAWKDFFSGVKGINQTSARVMSPVYAWGRKSENFCGHFEESQFAQRLLFTPGKVRPFQGLNLFQ